MKRDVVVPRTESALSREALGRFTEARVALGRAGSSLPTRAHLDFIGDHARARDAVWTAVDFDALGRGAAALGLVATLAHSRAASRAEYLRRPDLGRVLDYASASRVAAMAEACASKVAVVIADGLSAEAVQTNALPVLEALLPKFAEDGHGLTSLVMAEQGRVAIGDGVAAILGAAIMVVLIGERPGLSAADSLGCYVTWSPRVGTPDSRRNCVSNIRRGGLAAEDAAARIAWLVREALARGCSGVELKEHAPSEPAREVGVEGPGRIGQPETSNEY